jgi:hypothetical protein
MILVDNIFKMSEDLENILASYLEKHNGGPAQRSEKWKALKKITIGGSEVATVLGLNPFKKVKSLVAEKSDIPGYGFNGNDATRWGNLFESVTKDWISIILKMETPIFEANSLEGPIERQRYSPDGLGIAKLASNDGFDYFIILFEFKAPYKSIPDGKIPKQYIPQLLTGMLTIPIVETSIFVNNCYRKCPIADINFRATYDTIFHSGDLTKKLTKAQKITQVYAVGIIGFYQNEYNYDRFIKYVGYGSDNDSDEDEVIILSNNNYDLEILLNSYEEAIDFGTSKEYVVSRLLELVEEKRVGVEYLPMIVNDKVVNEMEFVQLHDLERKGTEYTSSELRKTLKKQYRSFTANCELENKVPIGYMPWKLVKTDIITLDRDPEWREKIEQPIKNALNSIDMISASEDKESTFINLYATVTDISEDEREEILEDNDDIFRSKDEDIYV